jgi:hypothetical protein
MHHVDFSAAVAATHRDLTSIQPAKHSRYSSPTCPVGRYMPARLTKRLDGMARHRVVDVAFLIRNKWITTDQPFELARLQMYYDLYVTTPNPYTYAQLCCFCQAQLQREWEIAA